MYNFFLDPYDISQSKYQNITINSTEPTYEPVTLSEAKNYLKVDYTTDDNLISSLIFSARKQIENELGGVAIVKRSFTQKQTGGIKEICLMRQPVNSITSLTYYDSFDSIGELIDPSEYRNVNEFIFSKNGFFNFGRNADGYVTVFNAGLVEDTQIGASTCPISLKTAILRIVAYLYENREEFATTIGEGGFSISYNSIVGNSEFKSLLAPYMVSKAVF
jgi:uncharacterized phiE125 gp8 family phage protein